MPTFEEVSQRFLSEKTNESIFPILPECYVNIQTEIGEAWGGLDRCGFTESQLSKNIHTVTVKLCYFYDDDGNPDNYCEDELLLVDYDFLSFFDFSIKGFDYGGRIDPKEETYWFLNHKKAEMYANELFGHLQKMGYKPIKKYVW